MTTFLLTVNSLIFLLVLQNEVSSEPDSFEQIRSKDNFDVSSDADFRERIYQNGTCTYKCGCEMWHRWWTDDGFQDGICLDYRYCDCDAYDNHRGKRNIQESERLGRRHGTSKLGKRDAEEIERLGRKRGTSKLGRRDTEESEKLGRRRGSSKLEKRDTEESERLGRRHGTSKLGKRDTKEIERHGRRRDTSKLEKRDIQESERLGRRRGSKRGKRDSAEIERFNRNEEWVHPFFKKEKRNLAESERMDKTQWWNLISGKKDSSELERRDHHTRLIDKIRQYITAKESERLLPKGLIIKFG